MKILAILSLMVVFAVPCFADLLVFDSFENGVIGEFPVGWQIKDGVTTDEFAVVDSPVVNGGKALKVDSRANDHDMWLEFGKSATVVSVEFWIYPDQIERSANFLMLNGSIARADAGPYLSWGAGTDGMITRYSGGWAPTATPFDAQVWTYVKIVADSDADTCDIYLGAGPNDLPDAPQEAGVGYRVPTDGFDRAMWLGWESVVGPAYVDDFMAYEGDVRPEGVISAVEPTNKVAATWGTIKSTY